MKSIDRRRASVLALLSALIGAAALFLGMGAAQADWPCNDQDPPQDTLLTLNDTYVAVDVYNLGSVSGAHGFWVCAAPTGGEGNQKVVLVTVDDPGASSAPGAAVNVGACGLPGISSEPHPWMAPAGRATRWRRPGPRSSLMSTPTPR